MRESLAEAGAPGSHRAPLAAAVRSSMAGPSEAFREVRRSEVEGESRSPEKRVHRAPLAADRTKKSLRAETFTGGGGKKFTGRDEENTSNLP